MGSLALELEDHNRPEGSDVETLVGASSNKVGSRSSQAAPWCTLSLVILLQVGAAWLSVAKPYRPQYEVQQGAHCEVDCLNCSSNDAWGHRGLEDWVSQGLGKQEYPFYGRNVSQCRHRTSAKSVSYKFAYRCSASARIRDWPSCVDAAASKGAFAGTGVYAFEARLLRTSSGRELKLAQYDPSGKVHGCRVTDDNGTIKQVRYDYDNWRILQARTLKNLTAGWRSFSSTSNCTYDEKQKRHVTKVLGFMYREHNRVGGFSCRKFGVDYVWNCTEDGPFAVMGNVSAISWDHFPWSEAYRSLKRVTLKNTTKYTDVTIDIGCQLRGLELCFVSAAEHDVKLVVIGTAICVSALLAWASGVPGVRSDGLLSSGELVRGSRRLAAATVLGANFVRVCKAFRFLQVLRVMMAFVMNMLHFRPMWVFSWYSLLYMPFSVYVHGIGKMLSMPVVIFIPMHSLFERLSLATKIHHVLSLLEVLPILTLILNHQTLSDAATHFEQTLGISIINELADASLASQEFGSIFGSLLSNGLLIVVGAYYGILWMMSSLPPNVNDFIKDLPRLAEDIEAAATQRLEDVERCGKPSTSFPVDVKPVTAFEELWAGGPCIWLGELSRSLLHFFLDILTDTYAWVLFLHGHDYFFAGWLATVSWWSTLLQVRRGLWQKLVSAFRSSNRCGVLTSEWIELLDLEKGLEAVLSTAVQLYAFLFSGFEDRYTLCFTLVSIGLSLKSMTDYLVDTADFDTLQDMS